jgi:hypothetical protein
MSNMVQNNLCYRWNKISHELVIVEAGRWVYRHSLYHSITIWNFPQYFYSKFLKELENKLEMKLKWWKHYVWAMEWPSF